MSLLFSKYISYTPKLSEFLIETNNLFILIYLFLFFIVGLSRIKKPSFFINLIQAIINFSDIRKDKVVKNKSIIIYEIIVFFIFLINMGIMIFLIVNNFNFAHDLKNKLIVIPIASATVLVFFIFKQILFFIVGVVFNTLEETKKYLNYQLMSMLAFGLILLPLLFTATYIHLPMHRYILLFTVFIGVLFYLLQIFRGFKIIFCNTVSIFYIFSYLCTLEILPLSIMYYLLNDWV